MYTDLAPDCGHRSVVREINSYKKHPRLVKLHRILVCLMCMMWCAYANMFQRMPSDILSLSPLGKRSSPGLRPQHLAVLQLMQRICQGTLHGDGSKSLGVGDTIITIAPKKGWLQRERTVDKPEVGQKGGLGAAGTPVEYRCELSTAGAVTLMLQAALPCLLFLQRPSRLILKGAKRGKHIF